jgi:hypothetical protein
VANHIERNCINIIELTKHIVEIFAKSFHTLGKILLAPLNFFPTNIYETHGINNRTQAGRPDLRALAGSLVKDRRRLPFGAALIAYQRGCVFYYHRDDNYCWKAIYTEDYQDIVKKWCF